MKNICKLLFIGAIALGLTSCTSTAYVAQSPVYQDAGPVTYQSFYDNLSPYGNWIEYPGYGHVWNPNAGAGFRPYATNGQWRYSNEGWAWQSNYNWGWAPFHYGRWIDDDSYGWLWVPGYDWSPAWVTWGSENNNYAWAPLMPDVNVGVEYNNWRPHSSYWNVVPREHLADRNISNMIVHYDHNNNINSNNNTNITNNNITKNITIINNYNTNRTNNYYAKGPDVNEVQRYTGNKIQPVSIKEVNQIHRPNKNGNTMEVYRPVVQNPQSPNQPVRAQQNNINPNNNNVNNNQNYKPATNPALSIHRNGDNISKPQVTPAPVAQPRLDQRGNAVFSQGNNKASNNNNNTPQQSNGNPHQPIASPQVQRQQAEQNNPHQQSQPQPQNQNQNQQRPQNIPQPRMFRKADPGQARPIREDSQDPINQPQQQRRNVQQLPIQRVQPINNSSNNNNNNNSSPKREHERPQ